MDNWAELDNEWDRSNNLQNIEEEGNLLSRKVEEEFQAIQRRNIKDNRHRNNIPRWRNKAQRTLQQIHTRLGTTLNQPVP